MQISESTVVFRSHKWYLELAAVIIVQSQLTGREKQIGIVGSKHVTAEEYLNGFRVDLSIVFLDDGELYPD
jgi:hypothetical protein